MLINPRRCTWAERPARNVRKDVLTDWRKAISPADGKFEMRDESCGGQFPARLSNPQSFRAQNLLISIILVKGNWEVCLPMSWDPVYRLVKQIPRGRVTTYGYLSKALRLRGGARAVGYAMAACPSGHGIPWHRVIGAGGRLLLSEPHASLQRRLLESEGIVVSGTRVDFERYGWNPKRKRVHKTALRSRVRP